MPGRLRLPGGGRDAAAALLTGRSPRLTFLTMVGSPNRDRKSERREATRREILAAAWDVAHESGLISVTLREIAARIGMRPPSLYSHFASKNAIFDAMFAQAWDEFHTVLEKAIPAFPADPRQRLLAGASTYFDFAVSDLERHQVADREVEV